MSGTSKTVICRNGINPQPLPEVQKPRPQGQPQPKPRAPTAQPGQPFESKVEQVLKRIESETIKGIYTAQKVTEMVKRVANQAPMVHQT